MEVDEWRERARKEAEVMSNPIYPHGRCTMSWYLLEYLLLLPFKAEHHL